MSLITPEFMGGRAEMMPSRGKVRVYSRLPRDRFASPYDSIAEIRPLKQTEVRGGDAGTKSKTREIIFQKPDLGAHVLGEGDVVMRLSDSSYWLIDDISTEQLDQRFRCVCSATMAPDFTDH